MPMTSSASSAAASSAPPASASAGGTAIPELAMDLDSIIKSSATPPFKRRGGAMLRRSAVRRSRAAATTTSTSTNTTSTTSTNNTNNSTKKKKKKTTTTTTATATVAAAGKRSHLYAHNRRATTLLHKPPSSIASAAAAAASRATPVKVSIFNLAYGVTEGDLIEIFTKHCNVLRAQVNYTAEGRSTGTGLLTFPSMAEAKKALHTFKGITLDEREMRLELNVSVSSLADSSTIASRLGTLKNTTAAAATAAATAASSSHKNKLLQRGKGGAPPNRARRAPKAARPGSGPKTLSDLDVDLDSYMSQRAGNAGLGAEPMQLD